MSLSFFVVESFRQRCCGSSAEKLAGFLFDYNW